VHLAETMMPPTPAKLWNARDVAMDLGGLEVGIDGRADFDEIAIAAQLIDERSQI